MMLLTVMLTLLKMTGANDKSTYVTQFRSQPNAVDFVTGGVGVNGTIWDIASFVIAAIGVYAVAIILSYRLHTVSRQLSVVVLGLTMVLLFFLLAVSNILLGLR